MELIRHLHNIKPRHRGCVMTIGNFDGVHRGHQLIVSQLREAASKENVPALMVTFEPHPQEFFSPGQAPARLMRLREKIEYLESLGVDRLLVLNFNERLASLTAEAFIQSIMIDKLAVKHLIVGDDFHFGRDRRGDVALLQKFGKQHAFELEIARTCEFNSQRISSSWVREALADGDMQLADNLLGRPYSLSGRVRHGDKRGRELGYPTLNIDLHRKVSPVTGIFVSEVHGLGKSALPSVTSIGTRPVFSGEHLLLESYLFEFERDVYGAYVTVVLLKKLRAEQMFDSVEALREQMERDILGARNYFKNKNKPVLT